MRFLNLDYLPGVTDPDLASRKVLQSKAKVRKVKVPPFVFSTPCCRKAQSCQRVFWSSALPCRHYFILRLPKLFQTKFLGVRLDYLSPDPAGCSVPFCTYKHSEDARQLYLRGGPLDTFYLLPKHKFDFIGRTMNLPCSSAHEHQSKSKTDS